MARFISPSKNLRLVMKPMRRQIVEGVPFRCPAKRSSFLMVFTKLMMKKNYNSFVIILFCKRLFETK